MSEAEKLAELKRLINRLLDRITDIRLMKRIYSIVDKLYCEQ